MNSTPGSNNNRYYAFRRAEALWAVEGKFFTGEFADSPSSMNPLAIPAAKVGWVVGTENGDGTADTVALTDVESIDFMERDGFVLFDSPEAAVIADAYIARLDAMNDAFVAPPIKRVFYDPTADGFASVR
jgi:hypothetical protein